MNKSTHSSEASENVDIGLGWHGVDWVSPINIRTLVAANLLAEATLAR